MRNLEQILTDLIQLLKRPGTDTGWSSYESAGEVVALTESLRLRSASDDSNALKDVVFHFLPTGTFQEIALASGWHDEYLRLADEVDGLDANPGQGTAP